MASGSKSSPKKEVEGFVHQVSKVKIPAGGSIYFDFTLQERDKEHRVVCFHPRNVKTSSRRKIKVTSSHFECQPAKARISTWQCQVYTGEVFKGTSNKKFVFPLERSVQCTSYGQEDYGFRKRFRSGVKLCPKSETQTVFSHAFKKDLKKCQLVIADQTGAIPITIWEDMISQVEKDNSYIFSNVKVSFYRVK